MDKLGVIGTASKADERRMPIHPDHLERIPADLRKRLVFERGYGAPFGIPDAQIESQVGGLASRQELMAELDAVLLPKPGPQDLGALREGALLWGWPHCVQQGPITQAAIDRKLTLIAFEAMYNWGPQGQIGRHTFYKNNELAGYCAVLHALELKGIDGLYGKPRKVLVFGFGAVCRGAIYALQARGFSDLTVCDFSPEHMIREELPGGTYLRARRGADGEPRQVATAADGSQRPVHELFADADIIVNGILQQTDNPITYIAKGEEDHLKPGALIIDVSCDEGLGFHFAKPTSFADPMFRAGPVDYYAVDHTPSYLWETSTRAISEALIPYLPTVMAGPEAWQSDETIRRAIEIDQGVIHNPRILSFQNRKPDFPHEVQS